MWCWHRIRESESGLCPACRTPYGEDPHQFTALDVEEVLKANKEKEKEKREQQRNNSASSTNASTNNAMGEAESIAALEVPKDRSSLANMRVIRRNLVYAVGLPPSIANEDTLRKPEYFGQYGKIAKIVLNRSQTVTPEGGDPRRASASAYVTFVHKEDTLSCILALDGFYLENRNIRASYGTSKYCSAFIKNVRCNNPECTYLHEMGAAEDTFTKQEIQAGYVTSGRDVLARQQQIVAEQLAAQQQQAAAGITSGGVPMPPRKRVGGGGPSGTGKASTHPIFPPPEFDEPAKLPPSVSVSAPVPVGGVIPRSASASIMTPAQQAALLNPATISAKLGRPTAMALAAGSNSSAPTPTSIKSVVVTPALPTPQPIRKTQSTGAASTSASSVAAISAAATTAASVVAGGRSLSKDSSDFPAVLTPLTPLKRITKASPTPVKSNVAEEKQGASRNGKKPVSSNRTTVRVATTTTSKIASPVSSDKPSEIDTISENLIGGELIGPPPLKSSIGADSSDSLASLGGLPVPLDYFSGNRSPAVANMLSSTSGLSSSLGGEIFTGSLSGTRGNSSSSMVIGGGSSLLGGIPLTQSASSDSGVAVGDTILRGSSCSTSLWSSGGPASLSSNHGIVSGSSIGNSGVIGSNRSNNTTSSNNSTSALASILGVNLPTGSGSLQESSSLWSPAPQPPPRRDHGLLSTLNESSIEQQNRGLLELSGPSLEHGSSLIGGVPIGGMGLAGLGTIGSGNTVGNAKSDIALLQSLLPGVHITTDTSPAFGSTASGWTPPGSNAQGYMSSDFGGNNGASAYGIPAGTRNNPMPSAPGSSIGTIGQGSGQLNRQRQGSSGLW
jgi:CCR4-NOT transcription complex subunit 4